MDHFFWPPLPLKVLTKAYDRKTQIPDWVHRSNFLVQKIKRAEPEFAEALENQTVTMVQMFPVQLGIREQLGLDELDDEVKPFFGMMRRAEALYSRVGKAEAKKRKLADMAADDVSPDTDDLHGVTVASLPSSPAECPTME